LLGLLGVAALLGPASSPTGCAPAPRPKLQAQVAEPPGAPPPRHLSHDCAAPGWEKAAHVNESSLAALPWSPFGRAETGWRVYAPLIASEIGVDCPPGSTGFARALAAWQGRHGVPVDGLLSQVTFIELKGLVQNRRPIRLLSAQGLCALPARESELVTLRPDEGLGDKVVQLRPGAAAAYRRMVAAARAADPQIAADPDLLKIFSGYRSPEYDAARCAADDNCNGRERAACSPHRTGLALDLYLGEASGFAPDSSADENRLAMTEGPAYRWMLLNAERFGFVNYPFEPWHWEWTGEAPKSSAAARPN
jgi:LAS superfamily LD-carboxypeptidase LdcB